MGKPNARRIALECLREWEKASAGRFAEEILENQCRRGRLDGSDRALAQSLFYGVTRNLTRLDALIDELRHGHLNRDTRRVLRLGMFQLFHSGIADHAAVNESVALARGMRNVVNGILRNAQRRREELTTLADSWPLAVSRSHPEFLIRRWERQFGEEAARELCEWNNRPPPVLARVNRLIRNAAETVDRSSLTARIKSRPGFYRIVEGTPPAGWIEEGLLYIQDPSTALGVDLLAPRRHEIILDACAAPGGKAALIGDRARNEGALFVADRSPDRLRRLASNLKQLGVKVAATEVIDWTRPPKSKLERLPKFDAILADVPCSNTGVMRRRIDVRWRLRPDEFSDRQRQQVAIVSACVPLLRPGGRLVYSTCSLEKEENRLAVDDLLERFPMLELEETAECRPWKDGFDGAFAARLRRKQS